MEVKAKAKNIRMSARKVRLVADMIRGMEAGSALDQLKFNKKWAAKPVAKLLNSAVANAENNFELDKNNLYVKEIRVDEGVALSRWMPKAHGRATPIRKRSSHIDITLAEVKESGVKEAKKIKVSEPVVLKSKPKEDEGVAIKEQEEKHEGSETEKGKKIADPRKEGRRGHAKIEGSSTKGFAKKIFQRKSG